MRSRALIAARQKWTTFAFVLTQMRLFRLLSTLMYHNIWPSFKRESKLNSGIFQNLMFNLPWTFPNTSKSTWTMSGSGNVLSWTIVASCLKPLDLKTKSTKQQLIQLIVPFVAAMHTTENAKSCIFTWLFLVKSSNLFLLAIGLTYR